MVEFEMPDGRKFAESVRQYEWRTHSVEKLAAERADRLRALEGRQESVLRAVEAYRDLPANCTTVRLRAEFMALSKPRELPPALGGPEPEHAPGRDTQLLDDYRTRPPSTKLLMGKTHALQSYLSMIYVAHAEPQAGKPVRSNAINAGGTKSWAVLCGRWASTPRARRARIQRDLEKMQQADLVAIKPPGVQGRYEHFTLLADDATGRTYTRPKGKLLTSDVVTLPPAFFTCGWHLVLTPAEIAVLLMARHIERALPESRYEPGVAVPRSTRCAVYGISGEAYGSIHELEEFGLLTVYDTMPHRRHGKLHLLSADGKAEVDASGDSTGPVPYRLETELDEAFDRPALDIIKSSLRGNPIPPRLTM